MGYMEHGSRKQEKSRTEQEEGQRHGTRQAQPRRKGKTWPRRTAEKPHVRRHRGKKGERKGEGR